MITSSYTNGSVTLKSSIAPTQVAAGVPWVRDALGVYVTVVNNITALWFAASTVS